jgi:hypothetical protein
MSGLNKLWQNCSRADFLQSGVEFLLGLGFLIVCVGGMTGHPLVLEWAPNLHLWIFYELAAAFILGLFHFVSYDDPKLPRWSRLIFAACMGFYVVFLLRHAWMVVLPLLAAKIISLWRHGTLTDESFTFRLLKGLYLLAYLAVGLLIWAVLSANNLWSESNEPVWPLALMIAVYYIGLGFWQAILAAMKRTSEPLG